MLRICMFILIGALTMFAADFQTDKFDTNKGPLAITFIGHGTLMLKWDGKTIHIDPWTRLADYTTLPKADLVLITHEHGDHLDVAAVDAVKKENTEIVLTEACVAKVQGKVMQNGDAAEVAGILVQAVPAYNIQHKRDNGEAFHPKGRGNGYVLTLGDKLVYIAGDTENIPEMAALKNIAIAFLPMNLPYTMTPEMVKDAAQKFNPTVLYPYHFGETDTQKLEQLLQDSKIDVRIRNLQ